MRNTETGTINTRTHSMTRTTGTENKFQLSNNRVFVNPGTKWKTCHIIMTVAKIIRLFNIFHPSNEKKAVELILLKEDKRTTKSSKVFRKKP